MKLKGKLKNLATALLFAATCTASALACINGGYPATGCGISKTYWLVGASCDVTCPAGYYACCTVNCLCISYGH